MRLLLNSSPPHQFTAASFKCNPKAVIFRALALDISLPTATAL
jgi:hypothetical protein